MPQQKDYVSPVFGGVAVTPNDGADLVDTTRALNVASSGVVSVVTLDGSILDLYIAAGIVFPIAVKRVRSTGTTAGGIVALW